MISIKEAHGWLSRVEKPRIKKEMELNFFQLQDSKIPLNLRERLARDLYVNSQTIADRVERLEILVYLGFIYASWDQLGRAEGAFQDALRDYPKNTHNWAVTKWMIGIVQWGLSHNANAYSNWFLAREVFQKCYLECVQKQDSQLAVWYAGLMDKIRVDMACCAEEAAHWLNYFEPSTLTPTAQQVVKRIMEDISQKKYPEAYEFSRILSGISRNRLDPRETAEAWVNIGLAAYQMGNNREAVTYWTRGANAYDPMSHHAATVKWMISVAQWALPTEYEKAVRNWQDTIEMYRNLETQADRANRQDQRDWYRGIAPVLKSAFEQMKRDKLGI